MQCSSRYYRSPLWRSFPITLPAGNERPVHDLIRSYSPARKAAAAHDALAGRRRTCFPARRSGRRRIASRQALAASCRLAAAQVCRPVSAAPSPSHAAQAATADHSMDTRYYWFASSRWHPALQIKSARSSFALSRISNAVKQARKRTHVTRHQTVMFQHTCYRDFGR